MESKVNEKIGLLVFSKDRALQLEGFIRSIGNTISAKENYCLYVLYTTSSFEHKRQYQYLRYLYPEVVFVPEVFFQDQVLLISLRHEYLGFFVDDSIFVGSWDLDLIIRSLVRKPSAIGFSIRLGRNTHYCFPLERKQELPVFENVGNNTLIFEWNGQDGDFGYPLELSSSIYRSGLISDCLKDAPKLNNPNELETYLDKKKTSFEKEFPELLCFESSVCFSNAINAVSELNENRTANNDHSEIVDLAKSFERGKRVNVDRYFGYCPDACHAGIPLHLMDSKMQKERHFTHSEILHFESGSVVSSKSPLISVIIPCYNYGNYIREALNSVMTQTLQSIEVIIVDGGSGNDTLKVLKTLEQERVRVYFREGRHLVGDNRNYGINKATGSFICCLDADDRLRPSYLEKVLMLIFSMGVDIVGSSRKEFGESDRISLVKEFPDIKDIAFENQFNTVSVFKKSLWNQIGGYKDTGLQGNHFYEDWHFWISCLLAGAKSMNLLKETLFHYRVHHSGSLSRQDNLVPNLNKQRAYVREHFPELNNGSEERSNPCPLYQSGTLSLIEDASSLDGINNWMLIIDSITTDWFTKDFIPFYEQNRGQFDHLIVCSLGDYQDKEDRVGELMDSYTPFHYDLKRSFAHVSAIEIIEYLIESKGIKKIITSSHVINENDRDMILLKRPNLQFSAIQDKFDRKKTFSDWNEVIIRSLGQKNQKSGGSEVWLLSIRSDRGLILCSDLFEPGVHENWDIVSCDASPIENALFLHEKKEIRLYLPPSARLEFLSHDWSGQIEILMGSHVTRIDLYNENSSVKRLFLDEITTSK